MSDPLFHPRHGLRYRWWRDVRWDIVVSVFAIILIWAFAVLVIGAWVFDWKDIPW